MSQMQHVEGAPFGTRGGISIVHTFPADGEYLFEMRPKESGAGGGFEGITAEPHQLDVSIDNVKVWTGTLGGPEFAQRRGEQVAAGEQALVGEVAHGAGHRSQQPDGHRRGRISSRCSRSRPI